MGRVIALITEDTETILIIINTITQVKITRPNITFKAGSFIAKPNNTPNVVAIPLPPLNPKNIVQLCPEIQLKPKIIRRTSSGKLILVVIRFPKKITATKPLMISKTKTVIPAVLPNTRRALVAPTLPEPNLRISIPFNNLTKI